MNENSKLVDIARAEIAKILAKLEIDTGQLVENVSVESIEVTTIGDPTIRYKKIVRIDLIRLPGHEWE